MAGLPGDLRLPGSARKHVLAAHRQTQGTFALRSPADAKGSTRCEGGPRRGAVQIGQSKSHQAKTPDVKCRVVIGIRLISTSRA